MTDKEKALAALKEAGAIQDRSDLDKYLVGEGHGRIQVRIRTGKRCEVSMPNQLVPVLLSPSGISLEEVRETEGFDEDRVRAAIEKTATIWANRGHMTELAAHQLVLAFMDVLKHPRSNEKKVPSGG